MSSDVAPFTHDLKTWPVYFDAIVTGRKRFELRKNDRVFSEGDILVLREWDPLRMHYTGRSARCKVLYMVENREFPEAVGEGYCVMSIQVLVVGA